jgi:epoxyqueuosine reductase
MSLAQDIKHKAIALGFDLAGITDVSALNNKHFKLFTDWLAFGYAGRMDYMRKNLDKRTSPAKLLNNAQSVICVGLNYTPPKKQLPKPTELMGRIANYAQFEDYHPFIKKQLRKLTDFISAIAGENLQFKICVDSAPLTERALAARAGLGFIGKNHMLINPTLGPQILLGEIITTLKLQTDEPTKPECSNCNNCIDACPTGALRADGQFDTNKCISYLTIEYKSRINPHLAETMGDWLFGCDECVLACPLQKDAPVCKNTQFKFYSDRATLNLRWVLDLTDENFEADFADSTIKRSGLDQLKRNAQICLANITR